MRLLVKEEQLEKALYKWFAQRRGTGMLPVSGPLLAEKARQLYEKFPQGSSSSATFTASSGWLWPSLQVRDGCGLHCKFGMVVAFTASSGWLWRFCKRHGIRQLSLEGEQLSSREDAVEPFKTFVRELMEGERPKLEQIYNCNETGLLNYLMLPDKTHAAKDENRAKGTKKQKARVTFMACSNAQEIISFPWFFSINPPFYTHYILEYGFG